MDDDKQKQEEAAAEQAALAEVKEDEVRAKLIAEYGFDEVDDAEKIDKLVTREIEHSKALSGAIGQKIKYRTKAEELEKNPPKPVEPPKKEPTVDVGNAVAKELDKRDLEALDYPPELKAEIQRIANTRGVSVKEALRDPYVAFKIGEHDKAKQTDEAAISRTNRSSGKKAYSIDNPPQVNMATEEGRKEWDAYLAWAKTQ